MSVSLWESFSTAVNNSLLSTSTPAHSNKKTIRRSLCPCKPPPRAHTQLVHDNVCLHHDDVYLMYGNVCLKYDNVCLSHDNVYLVSRPYISVHLRIACV